ncbi:MAG: AMP-binding protein [Cyclobacteriaceae bacterium]
MKYAHGSILLNGRPVSIHDILTQPVSGHSDFERETLAFIKIWLTDTQQFTLKTSGSTGTPKEITLTRQQLIDSANRTINKLKLTNKHTAFVCLDTKYIAGKMMLVRALQANMKIVAVEPAADPLKELNIQADFGAFVPLQLDEIFKTQSSVEKLNRFQSVIIGGTAVNAALLNKIKTLSCDVYATYGMTETVSHIALQKLNGPDAQHAFEVFPDVKISVDEHDCLVIEMPRVNEPLHTNDVVKLLGPKHFQVLGRYDNIINSGGVKLMPEAIEQKIQGVLNLPFFVAGVADERLGQKLVLVVEGTPATDLAAKLKQALSAYEMPKEILPTRQFERTETQKINRAKTLEKALKSHA